MRVRGVPPGGFTTGTLRHGAYTEKRQLGRNGDPDGCCEAQGALREDLGGARQGAELVSGFGGGEIGVGLAAADGAEGAALDEDLGGVGPGVVVAGHDEAVGPG